MNEPLVSVIMGVFNAEKTIENCIESIIRQTYNNWEFLICDDCSTDKTPTILRYYSDNYSQVTVIKNEKNLKLAASLNRCLCIARGKYIARMDADDLSLPNRLEVQVSFLEKHPEIDCVGCNRIIFDDNGSQGIRKTVETPTKELLLKSTPFAHPTIVMKKSVYDSLGGYTVSKETMRAEDLDLWFRFFTQGYKGYNIQEALYCYRETEDDFKKRTLRAAFGTSIVFIRGYNKLHFPFYKYIYSLKPIISALIPNKIMKFYQQRKLID